MIHIQKLCVLDVVENINVQVFSLMSRTNETRHIKSSEIIVIINNII